MHFYILLRQHSGAVSSVGASQLQDPQFDPEPGLLSVVGLTT